MGKIEAADCTLITLVVASFQSVAFSVFASISILIPSSDHFVTLTAESATCLGRLSSDLSILVDSAVTQLQDYGVKRIPDCFLRGARVSHKNFDKCMKSYLSLAFSSSFWHF